MKLSFILVLFIGLRDERPAAVAAQTVVTMVVGGQVTVNCSFLFSGLWKIFCRDECKGDKLLIQTCQTEAQNGRFSIRYDDASHSVAVTISELVLSDAGWYYCGLALPSSSSYTLSGFHLSVKDVSTPLRVQPSNSMSGEPRPLDTSQVPTQSPEEGPGVTPYVGVLLLVFTLVASLLVAVLVYRRKTTSTGLKSQSNTEDALYENCPPGVLEMNYQSLDPSSKENQHYATLSD